MLIREIDTSSSSTAITGLNEREIASEHVMNVILADSFTDSLARLTDEEQKVVKLTAFDLHSTLLIADSQCDTPFTSLRFGGRRRLCLH